MQVEFYFIAHDQMNAYKIAFEKYDREACLRLSQQLDIAEVLNIRPVSLADYKIIMELVEERQQLINSMR